MKEEDKLPSLDAAFAPTSTSLDAGNAHLTSLLGIIVRIQPNAQYLSNAPANFSWMIIAESSQILNEFGASKTRRRFDVNLSQQAASLYDRKKKNGIGDIKPLGRRCDGENSRTRLGHPSDLFLLHPTVQDLPFAFYWRNIHL